MLSTRVSSTLCSPKPIAALGRAVAPIYHGTSVLTSPHGAPLGIATSPINQYGSASRAFSTTGVIRMKDFFPVKETEHIRQTPAAWPHHGYSAQEMMDIPVGHREPQNFGDRWAYRLVKLAKWGMDRATGLSKEAEGKPLTERQWFIRVIFLESIAGVPGMVAGMLRHLGSLRRLKRDNGWIETLLEESYNERMHLLTFMKMCEPGWFMKTMIIGAQGVFFNSMFVSYLVNPRICHRFVGYLEEEAVSTYTRMLRELDAGCVPKWTDPNFQIPDIAIKYWNMPEGHRTMKDLILYIRADEANHRGVNHTLGNLDQKEDPNPFVSEYKSGRAPPKAALKPAGYEREEVI